MNWSRGLIRLWLIAAICWVALASVFMWDSIGSTDWGRIGATISTILGPPIAVLLLGLGVVWVIDGFRADDEQGRWDELDNTAKPRRRWWPW